MARQGTAAHGCRAAGTSGLHAPEASRGALKQFARERGLLYHTHLAEGKAETELYPSLDRPRRGG